MNLKTIILDCNLYEDSDEFMHMVFAKKQNDKFELYSEATVLRLTLDEMEMNLIDIRNSKCLGFDYFLEMNIIQDFYADIRNSEEYKTDDEKVTRIIYYAEFDA
ncbi:hypothetical protein FAZ19_18955 [Sphingobacterium alkalisoli]|uniref:Uncharacterized protein n=1 Tax=Sphingobacterium alkalisoli TaxID=1874115 RepID=A0A4U0GVG4_9SPHI|nr:hypothetical protein [Sphingobacterium alkalisoli]TJY62554.1 hypothetical protein FAZ19_18955 [Sphingobacterium alkalisoli]GGH27407.1 hypothetical protein GCM10011418_37330 [Sphingobacterium alkalisoli]